MTSIILLWLHLMSIAAAGASTLGIPVVAAAIRSAGPEVRPVLIGVARRLSMFGRGALLVLLITGPLLIWSKYAGNGDFGPWFSVKMVLVLLLTATVIFSGFNAKWMVQGNKAAQTRAPALALANLTLLALTVLAAAVTFI